MDKSSNSEPGTMKPLSVTADPAAAIALLAEAENLVGRGMETWEEVDPVELVNALRSALAKPTAPINVAAQSESAALSSSAREGKVDEAERCTATTRQIAAATPNEPTAEGAPALPEPAFLAQDECAWSAARVKEWSARNQSGVDKPLFTADQMREYALAAIAAHKAHETAA